MLDDEHSRVECAREGPHHRVDELRAVLQEKNERIEVLEDILQQYREI